MNSKKRVNVITFIVMGVLAMFATLCALSIDLSKKGYADSYEDSFVYYGDSQSSQLSALKVYAYKYFTSDVATSIGEVDNKDFVLLENADVTNLSKQKQGVCFVVEPQNEDVYISTLDVNVYLNGVQLSLGDSLWVDEDVVNTTSYRMRFYIEPNTKLYYYNQTDGENAKEVEDLQGVYQFDFKVRINDGGNVSSIYPQNVNWYRYTFTVLNQANFGIDEKDDLQFPRVLNVSKDPTDSGNSGYLRKNIYNYNSYSDKNGERVASYPTLRFDPERYRVEIKRTYNNVVYYINTNFVYTNQNFVETGKVSDYGILYFVYDNGETVGFKLARQNNGNFEFLEDFDKVKNSSINYNLPILYELGKYELTYKYQVYLNGEFLFENGEEQKVAIGTESLIVFGYMPMYAQNMTEEAHFISLAENKETDYSYKYITNNNLDMNFKVPELATFATTNQAPVWLNSYAYLDNDHIENSYYYYSKTGSDFKNNAGTMLNLADLNSLTKYSYSKNTYFTEAGYYIVLLKYSFEEFVGRNYYQVMLFRITNTTPTVKIVSNGNELGSGGFTKESVVVEVEKPKVFDSAITSMYCVDSTFNGKFGSYTSFTPKYIDEENYGYTTFTSQGKYKVRIYFNKNSYSEYSFVIDKQSLDGQVYVYSVQPYNATSSLFSIREDLNKKNVVNVPFTLQVKNKPSGSPITINLTTYDVVRQVNDTQTQVYETESGQTFVYTDYIVKNASSKQKYENIVESNNPVSIVNSKFVFNKQKIYMFEITDASGYRCVQSVFLDNTSSVILQYDENGSHVEVDDFNIVSEKTTMAWGSNKALLFSEALNQTDRLAMNLLMESNSSSGANAPKYIQSASQFMLLIPFTSIKVQSYDLKGTETNDKFNDYNKAQELTIYPDLVAYKDIKDSRIKGEKQYKIEITDASGNVTTYEIEMNMDKSVGKMFTTNTPSMYRSESGDNRLNLEQAGSLDAIVFEWKDAESGAYKIASLTYDFYPLKNDPTKANYPYDDVAEMTNVSLLDGKNKDAGSEFYYSTIINPIAITTSNYANGLIYTETKLVSQPGKYVITRVYESGYENIIDASGDTATRVYTFYVDSNPIIDVPDFNNEDEYYIGEGVEILFGPDNIPFTEFYREKLDTFAVTSISNKEYIIKYINLILNSNVLPIKVKVPQNKYAIESDSTALSYTSPATFDLTVILTRYNDNGSTDVIKQYSVRRDSTGKVIVDVFTTKYNNNVAGEPTRQTGSLTDGYIKIDDITKDGVYKLEIRDNALPANVKLSPSLENSDYIAFKVSLDRPNADILVGKKMYDVSPTTPLTLSVDEKNGTYIYEIDYSYVNDSIQVYRREKEGNGAFSNYKLISITPMSNKFELLAYETKNNRFYTYQYRLDGQLRVNGESFSQFTPIIDDFDKFTTIGDYATSTKSNYVILTFEDPKIEYYAKIDESDITVKRYEKNDKGIYQGAKKLVENIDYILEERLLEDGRVKYSIVIYAINDNEPQKEYKFEVNYHYLGEASYYSVVGSNGQTVNYYENSTVVVIDKTPPTYNITNIANLKANSEILAENGLSAYTTTYYKAEDGVYYYANTGLIDFAIDETYRFTRPEKSVNLESPSHEGERIYFRKLNKYNKDTNMTQYTAKDGNLARMYQSIVPGDPAYYEGNTAKLRFNPVITDTTVNDYENWIAFGYDYSMSFYDYLKSTYQAFRPNFIVEGYYEIVEIDEAGNYTIYTVLLEASAPSFTAKANEETGSVTKSYGVSTKEINSLNSFEIVSIDGLDVWGVITVNDKKFKLTADTNIDELLVQINSAFEINKTNKFTMTNRFGNNIDMNISITTADKMLGLTVSEIASSNGLYKVTFDNDAYGIMMKNVRVYVFASDDDRPGFVEYGYEDGVYRDSEGTQIIVDASVNGYKREYYFEEGIYRFEIEDNFRSGENANVIRKNIHIQGNYNIEYEKGLIFKNGVYYTYGNVVLTASKELFTVTATKNGVSVKVTPDMHIFKPEASSNDIDSVSGGEANYVVKIDDITTGETTIYEFTMYNIFPGVVAVDSQDESMNSILSLNKSQVSTFTTKAVRLSWSLSGYKFGYSVSLIRYDDGSDVPSSQMTINNTFVTVSNQGLYELKFTNSILGDSRSIYFMIKDSAISMYEVYQRMADNTLSVVMPADELLDITEYMRDIEAYLNGAHSMNYPLVNDTLLVKNYFSIYNFQIQVEGDKNLVTNFGNYEIKYIYDSELSNKFNTNIVVVYGVSPYSYLDIFAITKIQANAKFLEVFGYSYDTEIEKEVTVDDKTTTQKEVVETTVNIDAKTYDNQAVYDSPLKIFFQSYNGVSQNRVYMKYYFNGKYIDSVYGNEESDGVSSFIFNTAGEYRCEFYDLAGNRQLFSASNTSYFTLTLKNEVVYLVNGISPIYGAVYNDNVKLTIPDLTSYSTSVDVKVYKNGEEYKISSKALSKEIREYTFTEQGLYRVILNGSVRSGRGIKELKSSELIFSIINKNEARFAYEFSNINGYEISKVVKNDVDITDKVRGDNVAIYSLLLSESSFGVGHYHIYVKGNRLNTLNSTMEFDYYIWINNEIPTVMASIGFNETTTDVILLSYNSKAIYEQIGNCKIVIGNDEYVIDGATSEDKVSKIQITRAGTYFVTLKTEAGNVVSMFKVTKKDPLNAFSIILIVIGSIALIAVAIVFYRLRINMKVK